MHLSVKTLAHAKSYETVRGLRVIRGRTVQRIGFFVKYMGDKIMFKQSVLGMLLLATSVIAFAGPYAPCANMT